MKKIKYILGGLLVCGALIFSYVYTSTDTGEVMQASVNNLLGKEEPYKLKLNSNGTALITYDYDFDNRLKVLVLKEDSSIEYQYEMSGMNEIIIPFTEGNGNYLVKLCKHKEDTTYRVIRTWSIEVDVDDLILYKSSNYKVDWHANHPLNTITNDLCVGLDNDEARIQAIREYITSNYQYSTNKASSLADKGNYRVDLVRVLKEPKELVCSDFAVLSAAMLRSVDIPCKYVEGYSKKAKGYHAWNEVYLDGEWKVLDFAYDAQLKNDNVFKSKELYDEITYQY